MCVYSLEIEPSQLTMEEDIIDFSLAMFEADIDLLYDEIKDVVSDEEEESKSVSLQTESCTLHVDSNTLRAPVITIFGSDSDEDKLPAEPEIGERTLLQTESYTLQVDRSMLPISGSNSDKYKLTAVPEVASIPSSNISSDRQTLQNKKKLSKMKMCLDDAMKKFILKEDPAVRCVSLYF